MDATVQDRVWGAVLACRARNEPRLDMRRRDRSSLPAALASLGRAIAKDTAKREG